MPRAIRLYVRYVDALNTKVGQVTMYLVFFMMGILLFESIFRTFLNRPHIWVVEMAQFVMTTYYLIGGGYSMTLEGHVRMDLLYGRWSLRGRAVSDVLTCFFLIFYLVLLLLGGISSTRYALEYDQRNFTPWAPPLAPIKIIMVVGITLMLLQTIATFFRDLARATGKSLNEPGGDLPAARQGEP